MKVAYKGQEYDVSDNVVTQYNDYIGSLKFLEDFIREGVVDAKSLELAMIEEVEAAKEGNKCVANFIAGEGYAN